MAINPPIGVRLRPVIVAYLDELAATGGYGKGRAGVIRRFVENGIVRALERNVLQKKDAARFGETPDTEADDDE
ncbi:MAG: hypothetical protein J0H44_11670 [Alphaproteobacteria bacterium]|nr:hypothetical protein [Alphaproteobacteria bacterium]